MGGSGVAGIEGGGADGGAEGRAEGSAEGGGAAAARPGLSNEQLRSLMMPAGGGDDKGANGAAAAGEPKGKALAEGVEGGDGAGGR